MADDRLVIDLTTELNNFGVPFEADNKAEWLRVKCVFHDDQTPSCFINIAEQYFTCHSCKTGGSIIKFLARVIQQPLHHVFAVLSEKYKATKSEKPVEESTVERYHKLIWQMPFLLEELYKRGVNETLIRHYRWGADERGRIKIPIRNSSGVCVNIMSYTPGLKVGKKFINMTGRGKARLYPMEQLSFENILLCGGPAKAIVAAYELNPYGIGCVSNTDGEQVKNWPKDTAALLEGKKFLGACLDIDETGRKSAQNLIHRYHRCCTYPSIITLPLDPDVYPKGDINDYVGTEKKPLWPLIESAVRFEPEEFEQDQLAIPEKVALREACQAVNSNKRLEFRALVSTIDTEPFFLPKDVEVHCEKDQDFCHKCPIAAMNIDLPTVTLSPESEHLLQMINSPAKNQRDLIRKTLHIPPCKTVGFVTVKDYHVNQVRLTNDLDSGTGWEEETATLDAIALDIDLDLNETYDLTGRIVPHPNTQRATAVISASSTVIDSLNEYEADPHELQTFAVDGEVTLQSIDRRLREIYRDLENHVTLIWERFDLHLLYDLAFHSALYFKEGKKIQKGVVEVLVVGDSANGKSQIIESMIKHYGLGQKVNMENATVAGLLGGVDETGSKSRYISWGILPANHRRFVFMDELGAAPAEVLSKLTDLRSSGKAEIPKIKRGAAHARVRLAASSNPPRNQPVMSYAYGVNAIQEVIPHPEDIRRFDACMISSSSDVSQETMQRTADPSVAEKYTGEMCRAAVLFAWTRTPDQISFEDWPHLLKITEGLCSKYNGTIPIVDIGSTRFKIARLAIALAMRTYAANPDDPQAVLVRRSHVEYIALTLDRIYSSHAMGYDRYSAAINKQSNLLNHDEMIASFSRSPYPRELVERMLHASYFEAKDVGDWTSLDRTQSAQIVSLLVRSNAIIRDGPNRYRKTVSFTPFLQELLEENKLQEVGEAPTYLKGML